MPRYGGQVYPSPYADLGDPIGQLVSALLFGKAYRAAEKIKTELTPLIQKEELTGETQPGVNYMSALSPGMRAEVQKQYFKQTGEQIPRPAIPFPVGMTGTPIPATTAPAVAPGWPTTMAGMQARTEAELARGKKPTELPPGFPQEIATEHAITKIAAPYRALSQADYQYQPQLGEALTAAGYPVQAITPPRQESPFAATANQYNREFFLTPEEYQTLLTTGVAPTRKDLTRRFPPEHVSHPDIGARIDRFNELYEHGVETGQIKPELFRKWQDKVANNNEWPPSDVMPVVKKPTASPYAVQAREIARDLNRIGESVSQATVEQILATPGPVQDAFMARWDNATKIIKTRTLASQNIGYYLRAGDKKTAMAWVQALANSFGLKAPIQKNLLQKIVDGLGHITGLGGNDEEIQQAVEKSLLPFRTTPPISPGQPAGVKKPVTMDELDKHFLGSEKK